MTSCESEWNANVAHIVKTLPLDDDDGHGRGEPDAQHA